MLVYIMLSNTDSFTHLFLSLSLSGHEIVMIVVMFAVTIAVDGDSVKTAQFGQAFDVVVTGTYFLVAWLFLSRTGSKQQVRARGFFPSRDWIQTGLHDGEGYL